MAAPQKKKIRRSTTPCAYCVKGIEPDYKNTEDLSQYTAGRSRIVSRMTTGICQKHQKRMSRAIKRARYLSMMPYI
jgi:small subunit ribosomal protein S18